MRNVVLVTGASSGIGEQFARRLSADGYDLVVVARRVERLRELADELPTAVHVIGCDLGTEASSLADRISELGVHVDLLVNNAGFGTYGRFWEIDEDRDAEQVRVNCEAVITLTRAFLPAMVERGTGGVINIASTSGVQPLPYTATYAASKAFVLSFTEALHAELAGTGVRALTVNPGPVPTAWWDVAGIDTGPIVPGAIPAEQVVAEALDAYQRGRRSVVPGLITRWFTRGASLGPRAVGLSVAERLYRPRGHRKHEPPESALNRLHHRRVRLPRAAAGRALP